MCMLCARRNLLMFSRIQNGYIYVENGVQAAAGSSARAASAPRVAFALAACGCFSEA